MQALRDRFHLARWLMWRPLLGGSLIGLTIGAMLFALVAPTPKERAACDRAFGMLMEASSIVELERAKFLVHEARCSVMKRLIAMDESDSN